MGTRQKQTDERLTDERLTGENLTEEELDAAQGGAARAHYPSEWKYVPVRRTQAQAQAGGGFALPEVDDEVVIARAKGGTT